MAGDTIMVSVLSGNDIYALNLFSWAVFDSQCVVAVLQCPVL